ncbi:MAG: hypothetical protein ACRDID_02450, partial [Ktedonobacterales bacterium]
MSEQPNQPRLPASARFDPDDDDDELHVSGLAADQPPGRASRLPHLSLACLTPALRRVWRASGVVSLIALVAAAVALVAPHLPHLPAAHRQIPSTALQASDIEANCMAGSSWSRDGRQIAVVESNPCASASPSATTPPNLLIFDATTGKRVAGYSLD